MVSARKKRGARASSLIALGNLGNTGLSLPTRTHYLTLNRLINLIMTHSNIKLAHASLVLVAALMAVPAATYAETSAKVSAGIDAALTDGATAGLTGSATGTVIAPIVITHDSAKADLDVSGNITDDNSASSSSTASRAYLEAGASNDLQAHAKALVSSDQNVSSVSLSSTTVSMTYREPAKLFGFIKVHVPVQVTINTAGTATVSYPWYGFLLATNQAGLSIQAQALAQQNASAAATFTQHDEAKILDSLHTVLSNSATATASSK